MEHHEQHDQQQQDHQQQQQQQVHVVLLCAGSQQQRLQCSVLPSDTLAVVAEQVLAASELPENHRHLRFICAGQELFLDEPVSHRVLGSVLHVIAQPCTPAQPVLAPSASSGSKETPCDWLDVVDPGTVLMLVFGGILLLLWLLFLCYGHMFDRTSVCMLCLMTGSFIIPCTLCYLPANGGATTTSTTANSGSSTRGSSASYSSSRSSSGRSSPTGSAWWAAPSRPAAAAASASTASVWAAYSRTLSGSRESSLYSGAIPPRPHAPHAPADVRARAAASSRGAVIAAAP